jgi:putative transposase
LRTSADHPGGNLTLAIPKLRQGSFFPNCLEPRRRVDMALYAVVMEAHTGGISTRKAYALVEALGGASSISNAEVSRICRGLDEQLKAFLGRPLVHARFPYVYLDVTYLHGRLSRDMQLVSRAMVVAIGTNALGYREVHGIAADESEAEGFWRQCLDSLNERGLDGTRLVISDAHLGLTAAIKRMFQGCCWQRSRVHFLRNLPSHVPKAGQDMVSAAMKALFVIQAPDQVRGHCQRVAEMLRKQFPTAVPVMEAARDDLLAFLHFPQEHWHKIWSTNPLERLQNQIKRRTDAVSIFPNDAAITRLVGSQWLEHQNGWQLERRRFFSADTMAMILDLEEPLEWMDGDIDALSAPALT